MLYTYEGIIVYINQFCKDVVKLTPGVDDLVLVNKLLIKAGSGRLVDREFDWSAGRQSREVGMAEPLRVILIVSAICSGIYALVFFKNAITTGQINIEYILQIFIQFPGYRIARFAHLGDGTFSTDSGQKNKVKQAEGGSLIGINC